MTQIIINNGAFDNDPSADKTRISFDNVNSNFTELYAGLGLGGSILSINQPISMTGAVEGEPETQQVVDAITARTNNFTIPLGSIPLVSSYMPHIAGDSLTAYVRRNMYILNTGDGTYGATGSITLDVSNIIKIGEEIVKPDTVIDMGDIGATVISVAMNNASPSKTKLGLTLVTAVQLGVIENYIFDTPNGDYGTADLQTSSDNFIDLNAEPDISRNITDDALEPLTFSVDNTVNAKSLGRTNIFTQSNANVEIDLDANMFLEIGSGFLVRFEGTGTHTVDVVAGISYTFKQLDVVFVQKVAPDEWIVSRLGETAPADNIFADDLQFTTGVVNPSYSEGLIFYDDTKKAVSYYNDESDTTINIGQELVTKIYNDNGAILNNGTAVRLDGGVVSGIPTVVKSQADTVANVRAIGICTHDIPVGTTGYATVWGSVGGLDTSLWSAGDDLFISATVAGGLTNIEQGILKPIAVVTVSDVTVGEILIAQKPVINITAIGQITALASSTQAISTTPEVLEIFNNTPFEQNVDVVQTGASPYTAEMLPASIGAAGFYRVGFNITIDSITNSIFNFELYINDGPTGILGQVDLTNANTDAGSTSFSVITPVVIDNTDDIQIYTYSDSGTPTFTCESAVFNVERIGNV